MDVFVTGIARPVWSMIQAGGRVGQILFAVGIVAAACVVTVAWGSLRGKKLVGSHAPELLHAVGPSGAPMVFLLMVATYATAIGLLGTVLGLQELFASLGSDPRAMAGGISKALTCTGAGVGLSIGCGIAILALRGMSRPVVAACQAVLDEERRPISSPGTVRVQGAGMARRSVKQDGQKVSRREGAGDLGKASDSASGVRVVQVRAKDLTLTATMDAVGKVRYVLRRIDGREEFLTEEKAAWALPRMVDGASIHDLWAGKAWAESVRDAVKHRMVVETADSSCDAEGKGPR